MSGLAQQLAQLAGTTAKGLHRKGAFGAQRGRPSVLFDLKEAARYDEQYIFDVGRSGFEELSKLDKESFSPFERSFFDREVLSVRRQQMTKEQIDKIDVVIARFLHLLGGYLGLKAGQKCLEWLVRHFDVHVYHALPLLTAVLPYHETAIFSRVLALVDIEKDASIKKLFVFTKPYQESNTPLPRAELLGRCAKDFALLEHIFHAAVPRKLDGKKGHTSRFHASLAAAVLLGLIERTKFSSSVEANRKLLSTMIPLLAQCCRIHRTFKKIDGPHVPLNKRPSIDLLNTATMGIAMLARKGLLNVETGSNFVQLLSKALAFLSANVSGSLDESSAGDHVLQGIIVVAGSIRLPALSTSTLGALASVDGLVERISLLAQKSNVNDFSRPLCFSLAHALVAKPSEETVDNSKLSVLLQKLVESIRLNKTAIQDVMNLLITQCIEKPKKDSEESLDEPAIMLIRTISRIYPDVTDEVITERIHASSRKESENDPLFNLLSTAFTDGRHSIVAKGSTTVFVGMQHPSPSVRLSAVVKIRESLRKGEWSQDDVLSFGRLLLNRLKTDDSKNVVAECLRALRDTLATVKDDRKESFILETFQEVVSLLKLPEISRKIRHRALKLLVGPVLQDGQIERHAMKVEVVRMCSCFLFYNDKGSSLSNHDPFDIACEGLELYGTSIFQGLGKMLTEVVEKAALNGNALNEDDVVALRLSSVVKYAAGKLVDAADELRKFEESLVGHSGSISDLKVMILLRTLEISLDQDEIAWSALSLLLRELRYRLNTHVEAPPSVISDALKSRSEPSEIAKSLGLLSIPPPSVVTTLLGNDPANTPASLSLTLFALDVVPNLLPSTSKAFPDDDKLRLIVEAVDFMSFGGNACFHQRFAQYVDRWEDSRSMFLFVPMLHGMIGLTTTDDTAIAASEVFSSCLLAVASEFKNTDIVRVGGSESLLIEALLLLHLGSPLRKVRELALRIFGQEGKFPLHFAPEMHTEIVDRRQEIAQDSQYILAALQNCSTASVAPLLSAICSLDRRYASLQSNFLRICCSLESPAWKEGGKIIVRRLCESASELSREEFTLLEIVTEHYVETLTGEIDTLLPLWLESPRFTRIKKQDSPLLIGEILLNKMIAGSLNKEESSFISTLYCTGIQILLNKNADSAVLSSLRTVLKSLPFPKRAEETCTSENILLPRTVLGLELLQGSVHQTGLEACVRAATWISSIISKANKTSASIENDREEVLESKDYIIQLAFLALRSIVDRVAQQAESLKDKLLSSLDMDAITNIVKETQDSYTRSQGLILLARIASLDAENVIARLRDIIAGDRENLGDIGTFEYTTMEQTVDIVVPTVLHNEASVSALLDVFLSKTFLETMSADKRSRFVGRISHVMRSHLSTVVMFLLRAEVQHRSTGTQSLVNIALARASAKMRLSTVRDITVAAKEIQKGNEGVTSLGIKSSPFKALFIEKTLVYAEGLLRNDSVQEILISEEAAEDSDDAAEVDPQEALLGVIEATLTILECTIAKAGLDDVDIAARALLKTTQRLLSHSSFAEVVGRLVDHSDEHIQRRALQMLYSRLDAKVMPDVASEDVDKMLDLIEGLVSIVKRYVDAQNDVPPANVQYALLSLEGLASCFASHGQRLGAKSQQRDAILAQAIEPVMGCLETLQEGSSDAEGALSSAVFALYGSAMIALSSLVKGVKTLCLPFFNRIVDDIMNAFASQYSLHERLRACVLRRTLDSVTYGLTVETTGVDEEEDDDAGVQRAYRLGISLNNARGISILWTAVTALRSLVEAMPTFLGSHLPNIIASLLHPSIFAVFASEKGGSSIQINVSRAMKSLVSSIPVRLLLPGVFGAYSQLRKHSGKDSLIGLSSLLSRVCESMSDNDVQQYYRQILKFLLGLFEAFTEPPSPSEYSKKERLSRQAILHSAAETYLTLVLRMNEDMFKPMFSLLSEWVLRGSTQESESVDDEIQSSEEEDSDMEEEIRMNAATTSKEDSQKLLDVKMKIPVSHIPRMIFYYHLIKLLSSKLRSIFVPYFEECLPHTAAHLRVAVKSGAALTAILRSSKSRKVDSNKGISEVVSAEDVLEHSLRIELGAACLTALSDVCAHDREEIIGREFISELIPVVVEQLEPQAEDVVWLGEEDSGQRILPSAEAEGSRMQNLLFDVTKEERPKKKRSRSQQEEEDIQSTYDERLRRFVLPAIGGLAMRIHYAELADAESMSKDDKENAHITGTSLLRSLMTQVLMKARGDSSAAVKVGALSAFREIVKKSSEEFLVVLPEAIPYLHETMDDESDRVESLTRQIIKELEELTGENFDQYLK